MAKKARRPASDDQTSLGSFEEVEAKLTEFLTDAGGMMRVSTLRQMIRDEFGDPSDPTASRHFNKIIAQAAGGNSVFNLTQIDGQDSLTLAGAASNELVHFAVPANSEEARMLAESENALDMNEVSRVMKSVLCNSLDRCLDRVVLQVAVRTFFPNIDVDLAVLHIIATDRCFNPRDGLICVDSACC